VDKETELLLKNMSEDIHELKELNKSVISLMQETIVLRQQLEASNKRHDEGRKVLHKRLDAYGRIAFWFGSTIITAMGGVIIVLVERILG
jgi:hypothetical protein